MLSFKGGQEPFVPQLPLELQPPLDEQPPFVPHDILSDLVAAAQPLHSFFGAGEAHPVVNPAIAAKIMNALVRLCIRRVSWIAAFSQIKWT